jgi:hypothetical protein
MAELSISSVITGLVSGIISSILTYFSTRSKIRLDMTVEYDKDLRSKRLVLYKELWPKTKPLSPYGVESVLNFDVVKGVSEHMRDWYFAEGGIYLSKRSRKPYFRLKDLIQKVLDDKKLQQEHTRALHTAQRAEIVAAAHKLRTSLADDIRTRQGPWL